MKLKTDEEYKKIDEEEEKSRKENAKNTSKHFKEFDKSNKHWIEFIKDMPEKIQSQIMYASPFPSTAVMLWMSIGDAKERDVKLQIIEQWEKKQRLKRKGGKDKNGKK